MTERIMPIEEKDANTFDLAGGLFKIQIPGSETGNQFSLVELLNPPGVGSPLHRHIRADQAVYVLEGELEIVTDSESFTFARGQYGLVRRGTPHIEINRSHSNTRFLTVHSPGLFSEFVRLAGTPVPASTKVPVPSSLTIDDVRKIAKIGFEFDVEILTPLEQLVGQRSGELPVKLTATSAKFLK